MSSFDNFIKNHTTWLENEYVAGALTIFLILYASLAAPKLPDYIAKLFDYTLFKIIIFFLIVYMHKKNPTVALVAAIALMVSLMTLDKLKLHEGMTSVKSESEESDDLLTNLNNLINDALEFVTSNEGQVVMEETQLAVQEGILHPADAEMIINKVVLAEENKVSPIVAMSEQGAQQMASIAESVANGEIDSEQGQRMAAQIVIQENMAMSAQTLSTVDQEKQMLAQEVAKQRQNIEENTGSKMTQIQLRQLCAQIEADYYNQKMAEISKISEIVEFNGFDDYAPLYEEL